MVSFGPGVESPKRNAPLTKAQKRRRLAAKARAVKRQARAAEAHKKRLQYLNEWKRKRLAEINSSAKTAAEKRKSRNKVVSRYNNLRNAENRKFKRITQNNYYPPRLSVRVTDDIFEHYSLHRLFSTDVSTVGINNIEQGAQIFGSAIVDTEEYAQNLDESYTPALPTLDLGVSTLSGLITFEEIIDAEGNVTYTAHIDVPNSDDFYKINARLST
jgi:hypothetical protein